MTTLPIKLTADQGDPGGDPWPVSDTDALAELQTAVTRLSEVVAALAGTLTVTGPLTNTQLRATPVPTTTRFADENGVAYSADNPVPVDFGGTIAIENLNVEFESVISTVNSTSTPLAADATFTGQWEDVSSYAAITAAFKTDAMSAINGAVIEFSADGVDVITAEAGTVPANIGGASVIYPRARYVRVTYTNGPVAQTSLEAEVRFLFNPPAVTQTALGSPASDLTIGQVTKAALEGRIMSGPYAGLWSAIGTDGAGKLLVDTGLTIPTPQTDALTRAELDAAPVEVEVTNPVTSLAVSNFPATQPVTGPLTRTQLDAADVQVADDYDTAAHASDQAGANAVLTFTLAAGKMVLVDVDPTSSSDTANYRARATVDGTTPTAMTGFVCRPGTTYLPVACAGTVKVYAPSGVTVAVQTLGRS